MSSFSRRSFLQTSSVALAWAALPYRGSAERIPRHQGDRQSPFPQAGSPELKAVAEAGLHAATQAGALYADVVFGVIRKETWDKWQGTIYPIPKEELNASVGIRALVNGYWGFAGVDGIVTPDTMVTLARDAVAYAKLGARGTSRTVDLAQIPVVPDGHWVMPVEIDPFEVPYGEKIDLISTMCDYLIRNRVGVKTVAIPQFTKTERTFASSEGTFTSQVVYRSQCTLGAKLEPHFRTERGGSRAVDFLSPAGAGWEYFRRAPYQERADQLLEEAARSRVSKPIEIGRWDTVFDAKAMGRILSWTIGAGTELDRAMGYEANGVGTSFLNDPLAMLGTYQIGSQHVNVSMNRSMAEGAATVQWDDEGVTPSDTTLVKDGILVDYQTTRESASWLAPYYNRIGKPIQSNGCAGRDKANWPTAQCPPNFVLAPGQSDLAFEDLVADIERGYAVVGGLAFADQQALNGTGWGEMVYEIRNGKITDTVHDALYLFRTPEFWKNVVAIGGPQSVQSHGWSRGRSWGYYHPHTVSAVPAKVTQVAFTEKMRKA